MRLEAKEVSFGYDKKGSLVLEKESFSVNSGEIVGIFAPSGYGKSTLAMLLSGYYKGSEGEVLLEGKPIPKEGCSPIQLIYQHPEKAINPRWKLKEVLLEAGEIEEALLEDLGIEKEWLERYPIELSGGELQRFCVARALMAKPKFLICDEISTMLDVITQAQIWQKIISSARKENMGVVMVSHNMELAKKVCDRIYDLKEKKYL